MTFTFVESDPTETDPLQGELALLEHAISTGPVAQLWEAPLSLVIPRSYLRQPGIEEARAQFAAQGCPVWLRMSGGGLVPQGPGILNVSLAYAVPRAWRRGWNRSTSICAKSSPKGCARSAWKPIGRPWKDRSAMAASTWPGAPAIARARSQAQRSTGAAPRAVQTPDGQRHLVLAHAILLVDADPVDINARANAFEAAIHSGRHYDPAKVVSVREASGIDDATGLTETVKTAIRNAIARSTAPGQ
jgi:lipoate-protein ligase A